MTWGALETPHLVTLPTWWLRDVSPPQVFKQVVLGFVMFENRCECVLTLFFHSLFWQVVHRACPVGTGEAGPLKMSGGRGLGCRWQCAWTPREGRGGQGRPRQPHDGVARPAAEQWMPHASPECTQLQAGLWSCVWHLGVWCWPNDQAQELQGSGAPGEEQSLRGAPRAHMGHTALHATMCTWE